MVAIHITLPSGRPLVIDENICMEIGLPQDAEITCAHLKTAVEALEGISVDQQRIEQNGRQLSDDECPLTENESDAVVPISVLFELCGGKGGFGSMLRAMGSQRSGHETSNVEACRDLSGRRLRHVNDEKKIAAWFSKQGEREEAANKKKAVKRERAMTAPKHTYDHHAARIELNELSEHVDDSVKAGFAASVELSRKRLLDGPAPEAKKAKVTVRGGWDFSSDDSDDSEDQSNEKQDDGAEVDEGGEPAVEAETAAETKKAKTSPAATKAPPKASKSGKKKSRKRK